MNPLVTAIITVFNCELYVRHAILSILNQTYTNFELIIVDDGSTDNTSNIINEFSNLDKRVIILKNENNIGQSASANKALDIAKGKYIAKMDADDSSTKDRFQKQVLYLESHPEIFLCGTGVMICNEKLEPLKKWETVYEYEDLYSIFTALKGEIPIKHSSIMFRNNKSTRYRTKIIYAQDLDLFLRLIFAGYKFVNLKDICLHYRLHPNSVTHLKKTKRDLFIKKVEELHRERVVMGVDTYDKFKPSEFESKILQN